MQYKQSNNRGQANEEIKEESSEFDLASLPKPELTGHAWVQRGTMLVCQSCQFEHGNHIDPGYQLYGMDEKGYPLIRKIDVKH